MGCSGLGTNHGPKLVNTPSTNGCCKITDVHFKSELVNFFSLAKLVDNESFILHMGVRDFFAWLSFRSQGRL